MKSMGREVRLYGELRLKGGVENKLKEAIELAHKDDVDWAVMSLGNARRYARELLKIEGWLKGMGRYLKIYNTGLKYYSKISKIINLFLSHLFEINKISPQ